MKGKMIMEKRQQVILHLNKDNYVSIVQDVSNTVEIAIINDKGGVDSDTVKRYLNTQELAIELLKFNLDS